MNQEPIPAGSETKAEAVWASTTFVISAVFAELFLGPYLDPESRIGLSWLARPLIIFAVLYLIHRAAFLGLAGYKPSRKDLAFFSSVYLGSVIMLAFGRIVAGGLAAYAEKIHLSLVVLPESLHLGIPLAAGGLVIKAVLGLPNAIVFITGFSIILGIYAPTEPALPAFVAVTTLSACLSLATFRSRYAYVRAGLKVSLASVPLALASVLLSPSPSAADVFIRLGAGLSGGILLIFIAAGVTPIAEYLWGYVTDMRLLEMATLDHPLLKDLSVQAPGTWNHSMVMGMMAEAAADAIHANPVLARVGAYFHDIGKIKKPLYFVENQGHGENRHDKLSPSMSALIIRSHVKDGIELARKHKLPRPIEDMIPQHHGTALIEYFYEKAREEAREESPEAPEVDESLYTYPGPKPQTREAGILMLADGIEAAARTLSEPNLDRIQGLVQKMINKVFASGELDECDLTLNDLHHIAKSFTRVLNGIYHQRIAYAEPAEKVHEKDDHGGPGSELAGGDSAKKGRESSEKAADKESDEEDLKRLGIEPHPSERH